MTIEGRTITGRTTSPGREACSESYISGYLQVGLRLLMLSSLILLTGLVSVEARQPAFVTYDMTHFSYVPKQHRDKGLQKVEVIYECGFFRRDFVQGVNNCNGIPRYWPNDPVIRLRARESIGLPVVAIEIESTPWNLDTTDPVALPIAVELWQHLIEVWQEVNPETKILIYGTVPRVYWALMTQNLAQLQLYEAQAATIAPLYYNDLVAAWPSAYVHSDRPDIYRAERQWQIDICHRVYKTECYFAITPHYIDNIESGKDYVDSGTLRRLTMGQNSFLEIIETLRRDGANGVGLWIHPGHLPEDYESQMMAWSWSGGAQGTSRDKDLMWLNAVEKFLDSQMKRGQNRKHD
jgi:hypothetical protein